ncbi:MAG: hypothetical protein AAFV95_09245 [Bacteroidota bacterium]
MKVVLNFTLFCLPFLLTLSANAQQKKAAYSISINKFGKSADQIHPIQLQEVRAGVDTLYEIDGKYATRPTTRYTTVKDNFSLHNLKIFPGLKFRTDFRQEGNWLIIEDATTDSILQAYPPKTQGAKRRLAIDITKGVYIQKHNWCLSPITIPFKVFTANDSDSLDNNINTVESNINLALAVGFNTEKYIFKGGKEPELRSHQYFFGFAGINRLNLNALNTDFAIEEGREVSIATFSLGLGMQFGYKRFGLSVLSGFDFPVSTNAGEDWILRGNLWLGFGIGYHLFK